MAATLAHDDELIEQVGELLLGYLAQEGGGVSIKEIPKGPVSQAVIESVAPIPRKVALLVADALVVLRAALEHTLFAEAEFLNGGPLDEKPAKTIEMPARLTHEEFADWVAKRPRLAPESMKSGSELLRRVGGLQPFHRNVRPEPAPIGAADVPDEPREAPDARDHGGAASTTVAFILGSSAWFFAFGMGPC
ncbi:hypothetical protein [Cryobacterium fucosi]|uniref:Uncharacterized protein n=1 Tax=Cryobacterium fucosi TaxID=1259157 RepID=A0A4R9BFA6_9MICO|nr:hypothetical protein [Cryobacterium fucosi]TFD82517.1 hypothetical protein E3T48_02350 [Cryobacterium fucosi]